MPTFWMVLLWLIYFFFPFDIIPDFIPAVGRIDDLLLMLYLYWFYYRKGRKPPIGTSGRSTDPFGSSSGRSRNTESKSSEYRAEGYQSRPRGRSSEPKDPYLILGLERSATLEEIKHAYRELANRYHPDKVTHLGGEFQKLANEKFQDIQWAYDTLMREKQGA